jgi:hypothetical protein
MGATIMYMAGRSRLRRTAWYLGVLNQFLWASFAITTRTWGLVAGCLLYGGVYIRNIVRGD